MLNHAPEILEKYTQNESHEQFPHTNFEPINDKQTNKSQEINSKNYAHCSMVQTNHSWWS